ncbi:MAG TPA: hypothetical protein VN541_12680, partial [Tepidisphaeraceae bacterium]|nr:hypothetical protein [Tepidisphaeraceae bacterium]
MGKRRARRSMRAMMMAAAAASVSAIATSAGAATKTWADGNGQLIPVFWSTASDWSPTGVPATGDDVIVSGKVGGITLGGLNLTYDYTNGGGVTLNSLTLGQSGGAGTLVMSSAVTLVSLNEYLGNSGAGGSNGIGVITQTAGLNSVGSNGGVNTLYMGYNATDRGFYSLGGTGSLSCSGPLYVGYNGQGTFTQSGGSASLSFASPLDLGANLGSQGVYNLSGGTFTPSAGEFIGIAGTGTFNQTGGANNAVGGVTIATNNFGACAYTLTSGALNITNGGFSVADNGAGSMNQSGGSV